MRRVYAGTEINLDHLFCNGLTALQREEVPAEHFHRALYLAAEQIRRSNDLRLHPELERGISHLLTGEPFAPLDSVQALASEQGILRRSNGTYVIDRAALDADHDFHTIRLQNMVRVLANELDAIEPARRLLRRLVNLEPAALLAHMSETAQRQDAMEFHHDYELWFQPGVSRAPSIGEPFLLEAPGSALGVLLVHGYLGAPEQMRPLAEFLRGHGVSVYAVRLKGHGTTPEALTRVTWHAWMESLRRGYAALSPTCRHLVVGGLSLGGILALILAANRRLSVDGVFAINPPWRLRDRRSLLIPALSRWTGAMRWLGLRQGDVRRCNADSESPDINYAIDYLTGLRALRHATVACRRRLDHLQAPTLIVQSSHDPVVVPSGARALLDRVAAPSKAVAKPG
jgi:esterase/lipase